jgi:hypothetical protein
VTGTAGRRAEAVAMVAGVALVHEQRAAVAETAVAVRLNP